MEDKAIIRLWMVILGFIFAIVATLCFSNIFNRYEYLKKVDSTQVKIDNCVKQSQWNNGDATTANQTVQWCYANVK